MTGSVGTIARSTHRQCLVIILAAFVLASTVPAGAQESDYFTNWPPGDSPQEVGKHLAEHFVTSPHQYTATIHYSEAVAWYGALTFAQLTHDDALQTNLIQRFDPLLPGGAEAARIPVRHHVDDSVFGVIPLQIAIQTKDPKYQADGKYWADRQWENPQPDGLSAETRFWVDDMYMLTMLQLEAYRATGDRVYLDRDAKEMVAYLDKLQQPNGLFYHAPTCPSSGAAATDGSPPAWLKYCATCLRITPSVPASSPVTAS
jgi:unsaturated rhamnogalacturonyl hydrolase